MASLWVWNGSPDDKYDLMRYVNPTEKDVLSHPFAISRIASLEAQLSAALERKLKANDHKNGWSDCKIGWLVKRLNEEIDEMCAAWVDQQCSDDEFKSEALHNVIDEAADVANFAMMIADNARAILAAADGEEC
jgi:NTP pyrophosphatase (non-canonical NTP hydrolase)